MFAPIASKFIELLSQAISIPVRRNVMLHGHARDNAVSALGKIIKHQHGQIDLGATLAIWIGGFPMKYDKEEACLMHELLSDFFI